MKKKSIGALILSAALLISATASTFAYFTNTASTEVVTFRTGNVKVDFDRAQETPWELFTWGVNSPNNEILVTNSGQDVSNVAPGDIIRKKFKLANTGSLDAKVRLSIVDANGNAFPAGGSSPYDYPSGNWFEWKAYTLTSSGTQATVDIVYDVNDTNKQYAILDATTDQQVFVEVIVKVDKLLGNGALVSDKYNADDTIGSNTYANFDKQFSFRVKAEATQWNNPNWNESGN